MRRSGWRLALSGTLFACWIGYLAYLAATTTQPIVLARPQFLVADLYVIAEVKQQRFSEAFPEVLIGAAGTGVAAVLSNIPAQTEGPGDIATVREVVWGIKPGGLKGRKLFIKNLARSDSKLGWKGPGDYVLALSHAVDDGPDVYSVTLLPKTPGFPGSMGFLHPGEVGSRIYPLTPVTRRQVERIAAEYHQ